MATEVFVPEGRANGIDLQRTHAGRLRLYEMVNASVLENDGAILWAEILAQLHVEGFYAAQQTEVQMKKVWRDVKVCLRFFYN